MVTQLFGETEQVYFHNTDSEDPPQTHTFADIQAGMYIEMFNGLDSSFLLGVVETVTTGVTHTIIDVTVVKAEGGATELDATATSLTDGVRVKFFNMTEGELSLDGYMQTSGGTFTGLVKHKKEIVIEPTLPSRFVNIKNRYATNADGTNSGGSDNTQFGVNFDLDHGNSGYNTVKWTTRNGNVFAVYGGTQANAKYTGVITDGTHLVNKHYVDSSINAIPSGLGELYTLQTSGNSYLFDNGLGAPTDNSFRTESTSMQYNKTFHFKKLYESSGANAFLKDYEATPSSMFEIYDRGVLQVRTSIKNFVDSDRGNSSMMFDVSGISASVHSYNSLTSSKAYQVILTNMRKKPISLRTKLADKQKRKK